MVKAPIKTPLLSSSEPPVPAPAPAPSTIAATTSLSTPPVNSLSRVAAVVFLASLSNHGDNDNVDDDDDVTATDVEPKQEQKQTTHDDSENDDFVATIMGEVNKEYRLAIIEESAMVVAASDVDGENRTKPKRATAATATATTVELAIMQQVKMNGVSTKNDEQNEEMNSTTTNNIVASNSCEQSTQTDDDDNSSNSSSLQSVIVCMAYTNDANNNNNNNNNDTAVDTVEVINATDDDCDCDESKEAKNLNEYQMKNSCVACNVDAHFDSDSNNVSGNRENRINGIGEEIIENLNENESTFDQQCSTAIIASEISDECVDDFGHQSSIVNCSKNENSENDVSHHPPVNSELIDDVEHINQMDFNCDNAINTVMKIEDDLIELCDAIESKIDGNVVETIVEGDEIIDDVPCDLVNDQAVVSDDDSINAEFICKSVEIAVEKRNDNGHLDGDEDGGVDGDGDLDLDGDEDEDEETYCVGGQFYGDADVYDISPNFHIDSIGDDGGAAAMTNASSTAGIRSQIQNCDSEGDNSDDDEDDDEGVGDGDGEKVERKEVEAIRDDDGDEDAIAADEQRRKTASIVKEILSRVEANSRGIFIAEELKKQQFAAALAPPDFVDVSATSASALQVATLTPVALFSDLAGYEAHLHHYQHQHFQQQMQHHYSDQHHQQQHQQPYLHQHPHYHHHHHNPIQHQQHQQQHQATSSTGLLQPVHGSTSGPSSHHHHQQQHHLLHHSSQQEISPNHQHHCVHHHHAGPSGSNGVPAPPPPGLPHIHVHPLTVGVAGGASVPLASNSSSPSSSAPHAHAHLFPLQVISIAQSQSQSSGQSVQGATQQTATAITGSWPLVEAPIYIDANGEYRTFCPAHPQGPPPSAPNTTPSPALQQHKSRDNRGNGLLESPTSSMPIRISGSNRKALQGPTTVQMVSQNLPPPMPVPVQVQQGQVMQQYVSENGTLTHVVLSPQQYQQLHTGQGHIHAPFLAANGTSHFYSPLPTGFPSGPGGGPPHFHPITSGHLQPQPAQQMSHSPHSPSPPNNYHKDERTQRQHTKLLRKLDQKREMNSAKSTPAHSPSPRKNDLNGHHSNHNSNSNNHSGAGSTANNHNSIGHNHNHHNNHNHSTRRNASRNNNGGNGGSAGGAGMVGVGNMGVSGIVAGPSSLSTSEDGEEPSNIAEEEDDCQTMIDQLSAIQKPEVIDITSRSAKIIWEGPAIVDNLINTRNLRYNVLLSDRAKECKYKSLYKGESYDCIVQDLQPGQEYVVRLQVHYEKLQGSVSEPTEFTTPPCEPDQPLPPKIIVRTKNSLHLRWTAPYHNGAHIQHYILEYDEGKGSHFVEAAKTKSKQYILTKLTPSTVYNFRLAAVNECGPSMYSIVSTYSTSGNPPSVPKAPILQSATSTMLRLAWDRRSQDGEFVLQMLDRESGHGYLNMYNGVDTIYECCSLRRATSYQFRLRADNEAGSSPWSNEVTYKTHPERPGRPSKPQVKGKIHGTYFKVKWDPPNDRGGAEIIRYFLEICSGPKFERIYSGTETETICDRLQPGTSYQIRVACEGPGGQSGYSEVCTVTTEAIVPGAPEPPYCDNPPGPYASVLRFDKPDYNGGAPILEFEVQLSPIPKTAIKNSEDDANKSNNSQPPPAEIIYRGRDSYCVAKDLNPGSMYEARVRAINRIGAGHWSMKYKFSAAAASPFAPDAPAIVIKSPTHLIVTWKEPNNNGAPISEYRLESSYLLADIDEVRTTSSTATTTTTASTSSTTNDCNDYVPTEFTTCYRGMNTSADIRSLLPFTLYFFRVNASNSAGSSKFSPIVSTQTPAAVPPAPHFKGYEFTSNEVLLRWCEPDNNGSEITAYNIEYGDRSITTEDNSNEFKISGLTPETNYKFRVQAVNGIGAGPFSSYVKLTTLPSPPKPPTLECTGVGHNFIKLKWAGGKNLDFTKYYVEMYVNRAKDFQIVYSGTNCMCKVNKLQEQTSYTFRICAGNDIAGVGECSQPYVFKTSANLPSSIKAPRVAFEGGVCIINHSNGGNGNSGNAIPSGLISETQNFIAGLGGLTLGVPVTLEWQHSKNSFNDPVEYILQYAVGKETDYKQIYRGPETKFTIENLEPGAFYLFRVCPIRVTSTGDLSGQFTIPLRYHVPPLTSIDCIDGLQNNDGNTNNSTSSSHRSGGHHHHSHSHHNHHSRHNQSSGGLNGANGHHLHHRSVSASPGAAVVAASASSNNFNNNGSLLGTNTNQNGSGGGSGNSSLITSLHSGNAIGLIPLSAASDLASFAAAGCDDQLLLKVAAAAAAANSNNSHSHSTNNVVAANIAAAAAASVANSSNVSAGNSNSIVAGSILSSNFNVAAAANIGAIRRFTSKLTALYTNRKRFTDQEKAVIFMVSFLFLAILFAALVKMFTS